MVCKEISSVTLESPLEKRDICQIKVICFTSWELKYLSVTAYAHKIKGRVSADLKTHFGLKDVAQTLAQDKFPFSGAQSNRPLCARPPTGADEVVPCPYATSALDTARVSIQETLTEIIW